MRKFFLVFAFPALFFLISLLTLRDYGISWDEPIHFHRGQAYLYYILTGKTTFDQDKHSYYQSDQLPAEYWLSRDDGHPPLNGILASLSNLIFYQKLGILGDIESYHLFNILVSTILVAVVVVFAFETYGVFAAIIAGLTIATYPLFFAESHFNIKDPAQTSFFTLTIWAFWKSLERGSGRWLLVAAISAGFALGTKFNILFLPFIILPYLIFRYGIYVSAGWHKIFTGLKQIPKSYYLVFFISPFIVFGIFFGTWPFLWQDPLENIPFVVRWYQDIGTGQATFGYFLPNGLNLYAPIWILITTPPWIIFLLLVGIVAAFKKREDMGWTPILWLLWLFIPIARVVVPNTTIYGGVRQIMEFLPAMALLCGLGAAYLIQTLNIKYKQSLFFQNQNHISKFKIVRLFFLNFKLSFLFLIFAFSIYPIIRLHPNENVYFNFLIGGLSGAKEKGIPYWGNSFGNAYWQAVQWLNNNVPEGSKLALIQGTSLNIPKIQLRNDLRFSNSYWSGIYRDGEYLLELTHHDRRVYPYAWEYTEKFLEPVYEVKVEGVAIARVWKNDLINTKEEFKKGEVIFNGPINKSFEGNKIIFDLGSGFLLTRMVIFYEKVNCEKPQANVSTSLERESWKREPEGIPANQIVVREKEKAPSETFFFPARLARFVRLEEMKNNSCAVSSGPNFKLYVLEE